MGDQEFVAKGTEFFFEGDENVLKSIMVRVAQLCEYTKHSRIVHFKWANGKVCELYQ